MLLFTLTLFVILPPPQLCLSGISVPYMYSFGFSFGLLLVAITRSVENFIGRASASRYG
ncbi:hypothetical protein M378DRAFT_160338 [Amanita muscaria Koide BX008]|uniref:Uncharacterized protein n=1 Tax=Amanita muscaria (strain Koide BX008) TaxID=946122 RepID=A0A0C2XDB6_AMAMK|nr:hypothetical protein M378DRAFT_160338 [Amanita muscaria Koide BX008]